MKWKMMMHWHWEFWFDVATLEWLEWPFLCLSKRQLLIHQTDAVVAAVVLHQKFLE